MRIDTDDVVCHGVGCAARFPLVDGVPVLINEGRSVFALEQFLHRQKTYFDPAVDPRGLRMRIARLLYENSVDLKTSWLLTTFADLLVRTTPAPRVLVIGAGIAGAALPALAAHGIAVLMTDTALGGAVELVCDAHDIPFDDETFDGVVAQAVLEHVVDPYRCADEIHRVLKPSGVVFSDTPFMQQVHGGRYDFTRFTHLGHRRLFRRFQEIDSGASAGPGVALIWAWRYFLLSFARSRMADRALRIFAKGTSFWVKYFDRYLINRPAALDAASALYFIGRKSDTAIDDHRLLEEYRGANGG